MTGRAMMAYSYALLIILFAACVIFIVLGIRAFSRIKYSYSKEDTLEVKYKNIAKEIGIGLIFLLSSCVLSLGTYFVVDKYGLSINFNGQYYDTAGMAEALQLEPEIHYTDSVTEEHSEIVKTIYILDGNKVEYTYKIYKPKPIVLKKDIEGSDSGTYNDEDYRYIKLNVNN